MPYDFDPDFETKIAALLLRDPLFNVRADGLISPAHFSSDAEASLVAIHLAFWEKYKSTASPATLVRLIGAAKAAKKIRDDIYDDVKDAFKKLLTWDISDRDYVVDEVASFARHQAVLLALGTAADDLDKRDFDKIGASITKALGVGKNETAVAVSDFGSDVAARAHARTELVKARASGTPINSITTGCSDLDAMLHHRGWGRKELSLIMGGAKRGKSIWLMNASVNAWGAGYNVLHITLENSVEITTSRMDSYVSQVEMSELLNNIARVEMATQSFAARTHGVLKVHEYPTGAFRPSDLRRLVERYKAQGIVFDLMTIDYPDIMAPDRNYRDDKIAESASIYVGVRGIGQEENAAMLGATQTNRIGYKAQVADAEHVAEDFNRIRIADLVISINQDQDEKDDNKARLFFAAGRNQADKHTVHIEQDLSRMTFIKRVLPAGSF